MALFGHIFSSSSTTNLKDESTSNLELQAKLQNLRAEQVQTFQSCFTEQYEKDAERERQAIKQHFTSPKVKKIQKAILALTKRQKNLKSSKKAARIESEEQLKGLERVLADKYHKNCAKWDRASVKDIKSIAGQKNACNSKYQKNLNRIEHQIRKKTSTPEEKEKAKLMEKKIEEQRNLELQKFEESTAKVLHELDIKRKKLRDKHGKKVQDFKDQNLKDLRQYDNEIKTVSEDISDLTKKLMADEQYQEMQDKLSQLETELNRKKSALDEACLMKKLKHQFEEQEIQQLLEHRKSYPQTPKRKYNKAARLFPT